jgi:uncharacterized membrane protein
MFRDVVWNLMLAAVPVVQAYALGWLLGAPRKHRLLTRVIAVPLTLAWLVFLPNTCYLLTEWRHLLFDPQWEDLLNRTHMDHAAMLRTAEWALLFLGYSGTGVLLFTLSIRPVERWLRSVQTPFYWVAPPLFFVTSLGVYLGLIERLNSWNVVNRPQQVWQEALYALQSHTLLCSIVVFAALLWALYEAVDIWADGVAERIPRIKKDQRGQLNSSLAVQPIMEGQGANSSCQRVQRITSGAGGAGGGREAAAAYDGVGSGPLQR